ncbi:hypothetical protein LCL95_05220 [Bacillus timonensis]|nr:hypothetical protein [Bacillus timonensis]
MNSNGDIGKFQVCATCFHFSAKKYPAGMSYSCTRLGYVTKPDYVFNCWVPRDHVKKLIIKRIRPNEGD